MDWGFINSLLGIMLTLATLVAVYVLFTHKQRRKRVRGREQD